MMELKNIMNNYLEPMVPYQEIAVFFLIKVSIDKNCTIGKWEFYYVQKKMRYLIDFDFIGKRVSHSRHEVGSSFKYIMFDFLPANNGKWKLKNSRCALDDYY